MIFDYLKEVSTSSLNFDVYHPKGDEWETFKREWKQTKGFIIPSTPFVEDNEEGSTSKDQVPEDTTPNEEVPSEPTNEPSKGEG